MIDQIMMAIFSLIQVVVHSLIKLPIIAILYLFTIPIDILDDSYTAKYNKYDSCYGKRFHSFLYTIWEFGWIELNAKN